MSRTQFLQAYCERQRELRGGSLYRGSPRPLTSVQEADYHADDRFEAARQWRLNKNRLQNLTVEQWQKAEQEKTDRES